MAQPSSTAGEATRKDDAQSNRKPPQYNPNWKGYSFLILSSLINLSAISNVRESGNYVGNKQVAVAFPAVTLILSFLILVVDRTQLGVDKFNYNTAWEGRLEGYVLIFITLWSTAGVSYITQVKGIAYLVFNVYISSWTGLASAVYTLNKWSTKHDILSIQELTGISVTLKSWYVLLLSSIVVLGTSINIYVFQVDFDPVQTSILGMFLGSVSTLISATFILIHYRIVECCDHGKWQEVVAALFLMLIWIMGCAVLTQEGAIGATLAGRGCESLTFYDLYYNRDDFFEDGVLELVNYTQECRVTVVVDNSVSTDASNKTVMNITTNCMELISALGQEQATPIPGSNLYVALWTCLGATVQILLRWKAQQAVQFAAQAEQRQNAAVAKEALDEDNSGSEMDSDEELDDFVDATDD